jgi:hypothetical protein
MQDTNTSPRGQRSTCRSCGEPIIWVTTERGKKMPLDAEPHPERRGQFVFTGPGTVRFGAPGTPIPVGVETFVSHFSTCPHAQQHRKKEAPKRSAESVDQARGILAAFRGAAS